MPLPHPLAALLASSAFWRCFFWEDEAQPPGEDEALVDVADFVVPLRIEANLGLDLGVSASCGYISLSLVHPDLASPVEIAWDDTAHWHPHVMRWAELDELCRALADADPDFPHPGLSLLLLHRFAPICEGDDAPGIVALLEQAWAAIPSVSADEVASRIQRADHRHDGFRWVASGGVSSLEQDPARREACIAEPYSMRHADNAEFPHATYEDLFRRVRARLAAAGRPLGLAAYGPPRTTLPSRFQAQLELPHPSIDHAAPDPTRVVAAVDSALRAAGLGTAEISGASLRQSPGRLPHLGVDVCHDRHPRRPRTGRLSGPTRSRRPGGLTRDAVRAALPRAARSPARRPVSGGTAAAQRQRNGIGEGRVVTSDVATGSRDQAAARSTQRRRRGGQSTCWTTTVLPLRTDQNR